MKYAVIDIYEGAFNDNMCSIQGSNFYYIGTGALNDTQSYPSQHLRPSNLVS